MTMENRGFTRREALRSLVGASPLLVPGILNQLLAQDSRADPLAPRASHFSAKAKRVIFLCMSGGVSHVDTFDYKPKLIADAGKAVNGKTPLLGPLWNFKPRGKCGTFVSDLFPHVAECVDEMCVIRSMHSDHNDHFQSTLGIHTGSVTFARPSIGSWVSYGLGTLNQNLPSFVVIAPALPYTGTQVWSSDFLPPYHQGTLVVPGEEPIPNLKPRVAPADLRQMELDLVESMNREHMKAREADSALSARIRSFETAFMMQQQAPEVFDLSKESDETLKLYGLERGSTKGFAWQCLVARRLAERGVRFIELIDVGAHNNWDAHGDVRSYVPLARNVDQAIAGLIRDLKSRGMLEETLVVWTSEFGRTPSAEGKTGRSHHSSVFSSWMAGGGAKGGIAYGESDEHGFKVAKDECHVHDFHATILHLLGLDHTKLTFRHAGRDFRLTDVHGRVVNDIIA